MSILSGIESIFRGIFEGGVRRAFRPNLQPAEIAHALERLMAERKVVGSTSVDVPNAYVASINPADFDRLSALRSTIERDAAAQLERRALEEQFRPIGPIRVELVADPAVPVSFVRGDAIFDEVATARVAIGLEQTRRLEPLPPSPEPAAPVALTLVAEDGQEIKVDGQPVKLGRARDNDVVIRDIRVSRYHAVIEPTVGGWVVRDLQSTNGTFVDGRRIDEVIIESPTEISLGGCRLVPRAS
jgi:hypothetical protein